MALLYLGNGLAMALAMTCAHGKVMSTTCRYTPTVETCVWEAERDITDKCLRDCIIAGCRGIRVDCASDRALAQCAIPKEDGQVGGAANPIGHDCTAPADELYWCELPVTERCRAQIAVHELAHTCGWRHGNGLGVPGDYRKFSCD